MNVLEPLKISSIDLNKIAYPKQKDTPSKKIILMKLASKGSFNNFVFQTPSLLNNNKPKKQNDYVELELSLVGKEKDKITNFVAFLNELEEKVKEDAQFNASTWFNINDDNQTINFQKIIRDEGTLKIKLVKSNDFETILQSNNKRISIENIPENSWCKMILECYAVWINQNNDFGIYLRPIMISFTPKEKQIYNYKFAESDEEDDFEVPDTETNDSVFMKIDRNHQHNDDHHNSTSQLELPNLEINLNETFDSDSDSESDTDSDIIKEIINKKSPDSTLINDSDDSDQEIVSKNTHETI